MIDFSAAPQLDLREQHFRIPGPGKGMSLFLRFYGRFDRREAPQFYPDVQGSETKHPEPAH